MHFYPGKPIHFYSGVDTRLIILGASTGIRFTEGLFLPRRGWGSRQQLRQSRQDPRDRSTNQQPNRQKA
jgi:hypothetical protein